MERDDSEDFLNFKDLEEEKSFVTKVRSRVSGLFNSSISRIFGNQERRESVIRRREDDDIFESQPPCKKLKKPLESSDFKNFNHLYGNYSLGHTFTNVMEAVAGPSGEKQTNFHKKMSSPCTYTKIINEEKDSDSGESTSGYSSMPRICNREVVRPVLESKTTLHQSISRFSSEKKIESKKLFGHLSPERSNRSLFADSCLSPLVKNKSQSSRRSSLNTSNFSSPNFIDRTVTTNRIINSPFYNGPTVYGGASAYNRHMKVNESRKQQLKHSFIVKPVNKQIVNNSCTSLSKTARRILNALEQYSMPIKDADKIPLPTKIEKREGLLSKYVGVYPYLARDSHVCSNKELLVPSVPELLRIKQKQRLQDTTDKIRQIATSSKNALNTEYKICEDNQQKYTNKIKAKISSLRSKAPAVEVIENIVLNSVPLTFSENKLPKFDLVIPPPDSLKNEYTKEKDIRACVERIPSQNLEVKDAKRKGFVTEYTFAEPLVIADNLKSVVPINNFKFSEPLSRKKALHEKGSNKTMPVTKVFVVKETKTNNGEISSINFVAQNSVGSTNGGKNIMEKLKAPEGSWSCSTCLIRNKKDSLKCVACETLRATQSAKVGIKLNEKANEWQCSSCFKRNINQHVKCVACSSPKVSSNEFKSNGFGNEKREGEAWGSTMQDHLKELSVLGDKFKPAPDFWECQICLVRNEASVEKCIACEYERGKGKKIFHSQLKCSNGTWECDTCLIRNKNELQNCAACQTPKEKVFVPLGTPLNNTSDKWDCSTCLVRNNVNVKKCVCCETPKAQVTLINKNTVNMFNFGVNKKQFNFGIPKVETNQLETYSSLPVTNSISKLEVLPKSAPSGSSSGDKGNDKTVKELKISKDDLSTPVQPSICSEYKSDDKNMKTTSVFKFGSSSSLSKFTTENTGTSPHQLRPTPFLSNATTESNFPNTTPENIKLLSSTKPLITNIGYKSPTSNPTYTLRPLIQATMKDYIMAGGNTTAINLFNNHKSKTENKLPVSSEPKTTFIFENKSTDSLISFGNTENSVSEPVIKPVFSFGSCSPPAEVFNFNSNTTNIEHNLEGIKPKCTVGVTFNKPKSDTNIFDRSAIPVNTKNGGFNFGNAPVNNNQAAVFSFGASQNSAQTGPNLRQSSSGGFNFSSSVIPTGGFNFSTPTPTFDASMKPSFNFTGGTTPTFAATPAEAGGPNTARKFKKAVRRAAHR